MGGFRFRVNGDVVCLTTKDWADLLDTKELDWPDRLLEPEILDRNKADWVLKSLALAQAIWFTTQAIGRAAQGLPVTTLELFTLGIIFCSLFMYLAWWSKPFDVRCPIILELRRPLPIATPMYRRTRLNPIDGTTHYVSKPPRNLTVCITVLFGALHLVGWQFYFPTDWEKWLWRATSVACVVLPMLLLTMFWLGMTETNIRFSFFMVVLGLYALCRMYMMVEMFINLRALPVDAYRTPQWSQYLPSFG